MKVKKESEKVGLKLNIQKTKTVISEPFTSWQIYGETMETVINFIFLHYKIAPDGDCSVRNRTLGPPLENNPEIPPSSREEGLRLLHGLEATLATSLQTPQEA